MYALGFKTHLDKDVITYYIDIESKNHTEIILSFVNELLRSRYSNIRFYCHNLGGYDIVFILKTLFEYNESTSDETIKYKINLTLRDNRILKCVISKGKQNLVLIDSYPILPKSLASWGKDFNVYTSIDKTTKLEISKIIEFYPLYQKFLKI